VRRESSMFIVPVPPQSVSRLATVLDLQRERTKPAHEVPQSLW
jgi:hypothetical protein